MVNFPFGTRATKRMTSARMRAPALDFGMRASVRFASGRLQRFLRRTVPDDRHVSQTAGPFREGLLPVIKYVRRLNALRVSVKTAVEPLMFTDEH